MELLKTSRILLPYSYTLEWFRSFNFSSLDLLHWILGFIYYGISTNLGKFQIREFYWIYIFDGSYSGLLLIRSNNNIFITPIEQNSVPIWYFLSRIKFINHAMYLNIFRLLHLSGLDSVLTYLSLPMFFFLKYNISAMSYYY